MSKAISHRAFLFVASVLSIGGCNAAAAEPLTQPATAINTKSGNGVCRLHKMGASWAEYYTSMSDLQSHSDLGISGEVSRVVDTIQKSRDPLHQIVEIKTTDVVWLSDPNRVVPTSVNVAQAGGVIEGAAFEIEHDPLMRPGDRLVVYLREYEPGQYKIVGGPTGRFAVSNNVVTPIAKDAMVLPSGTTVQDLSRM